MAIAEACFEASEIARTTVHTARCVRLRNRSVINMTIFMIDIPGTEENG